MLGDMQQQQQQQRQAMMQPQQQAFNQQQQNLAQMDNMLGGPEEARMLGQRQALMAQNQFGQGGGTKQPDRWFNAQRKGQMGGMQRAPGGNRKMGGRY